MDSGTAPHNITTKGIHLGPTFRGIQEARRGLVVLSTGYELSDQGITPPPGLQSHSLLIPHMF